MNVELTPKQVQILKMLGLGMPRKAIAADLGISLKTLEFHIAGTENPRSIKSVLGIETSEMVRFAIEHGLVKPGEKNMNDRLPGSAKAGTPTAKAGVPLKTTSDLAQALLNAAGQAAAGTADVLQVNALCQCTHSLIELARLQIQANDRLGDEKRCVPWLLGE